MGVTKRSRTKKVDRKGSHSTRSYKKKAWNKGISGSTSKKHQSTSAAKLINQDYPESNFKGYRIFDIEILSKILTDVTCCKLCGSDVVFKEVQRFGLGGDYTLNCQGCGFIQHFSNCSKIGRRNTGYEINQRSVLASRMVGNGLSDLRVFCGIMDLPPPINPSAFNKLETTLLQAATEEAGASVRKAVEKELILSEASKKEDTRERRQGGEEETDHETEEERDETIEEDNNPRPLEVSGDGTWQRRI